MLSIVPCTLTEANEFIRKHHRHNQPMPGAKFCVAVAADHVVVGVAIVGRPVSRMLDDGWTLEVSRTCTDGTKNANSMLYGRCQRICFALGYKKLVTYSMQHESGSSLIAAGWKCVSKTNGESWNRHSRPRVDLHPLQARLRWEVTMEV